MTKARTQLENNREHLIGPGVLKNAGNIPMVNGYSPNLDQDIATKAYVDSLASSPNQAPTDPTVGLIDEGTSGTSSSTTLGGATDSDGTVDYYKVVINSGDVTVSQETVAAGDPHTFNFGSAGSFSYTAYAIDDDSALSPGSTVNGTVSDAPNDPPTNPTTGLIDEGTAGMNVQTTLGGATDSDGNIVAYYVSIISGDVTVSQEEVSDGQPHTFNFGSAGSFSYIAKSKDNSGDYSSGVTINGTINEAPNDPPTNPTTGLLNSGTVNTNTQTTLGGATDSDGTIEYYRVVINSGGVTVSQETVAAGNSHTFNFGSNSGSFSYTAYAIDDDGDMSSGNNVNGTINDAPNDPPTDPTTGLIDEGTEGTNTQTTLGGATDSDGTVDYYKVVINSGDVNVSQEIVTAGDPHTFNFGSAGSFSYTAYAIDDDGATSSGVVVNGTINEAPNQAPSDPSTGLLNSGISGTSSSTTLGGATDPDGTVDYYRVVITSGDVTVSQETVAAGNSHTFNFGAAGSFSYKAYAIDNDGALSPASTVNGTVSDAPNDPPTDPTTGLIDEGTAGTSSSTVLDGATDSDGTVVSYLINIISGDVSLTSGEVQAGNPHTFNFGSAGSFSYTAYARDDDNDLSPGVTINGTINEAPNQAPTDPSTGLLNSGTSGTSSSTTLGGATDSDGTVDYYKVVINSGDVTVSQETVPAGNSHTFNFGAAGSFSYTAYAIDDDGALSPGSTVNGTVSDAPNDPPTDPTTGLIDEGTAGTNVQTTLGGATDSDGTVDYYKVVINSGDVTVSQETVPAGNSHTFNFGAAGSFSYTAYAIDDDGATSSGVVVNGNVKKAPGPITGFTASNNLIKEIKVTWTHDQPGNPSPIYDLYDSNSTKVASNITSGYHYSHIGSIDLYVKATNSEGEANSSSDNGEGLQKPNDGQAITGFNATDDKVDLIKVTWDEFTAGNEGYPAPRFDLYSDDDSNFYVENIQNGYEHQMSQGGTITNLYVKASNSSGEVISNMDDGVALHPPGIFTSFYASDDREGEIVVSWVQNDVGYPAATYTIHDNQGNVYAGPGITSGGSFSHEGFLDLVVTATNPSDNTLTIDSDEDDGYGLVAPGSFDSFTASDDQENQIIINWTLNNVGDPAARIDLLNANANDDVLVSGIDYDNTETAYIIDNITGYYNYKLRAVNPNNSNINTETAPDQGVGCSAPEFDANNPITASDNLENEVLIEWKMAHQGLPPAQYQIFGDDGSGETLLYTTTDSSERSYSYKPFEGDIDVYIIATNPNNINLNDITPTVTGTGQEQSHAPSAIDDFDATDDLEDQIKCTWTHSDPGTPAATYEIWNSGDSSALVTSIADGTTEVTFNVNGGGTYSQLYVKAINSSATDGVNSNNDSGTALHKPAVVTNLNASTDRENEIYVSWTKENEGYPTNTDYAIFDLTDPSWPVIIDTVHDVDNYLITNVSGDMDIAVRSINPIDSDLYTDSGIITGTALTAPSKVTDVAATNMGPGYDSTPSTTAIEDAIKVTWTPETDGYPESKYEILNADDPQNIITLGTTSQGATSFTISNPNPKRIDNIIVRSINPNNSALKADSDPVLGEVKWLFNMAIIATGNPNGSDLADLFSADGGSLIGTYITSTVYRVYSYDNVTRVFLKNTSNSIQSNITGIYLMNCETLTSMSRMFGPSNNVYLTNISTITFESYCNTSHVTNFSYLFNKMNYNTGNDISFDFGGFDTSSATNLEGVFNLMNSQTSEINLSSIDTSSATTLQNMFAWVKSTTITAPFSTANVSSFSGVFYECSNLDALPSSNWNTSNGATFNYMHFNNGFTGNLDVSNYNVAKATTIEKLFSATSQITSIKMPAGLSSTSNINMEGLFKDCSNLECIDYIDSTNSSNKTDMFDNCNNLVAPNSSEQADITDSNGANWTNPNSCP